MLHSAITECRPRSVVVHYLHPLDVKAETLGRLHAVVTEAGGDFRPTGVHEGELDGVTGTDYFPSLIWYRSLLPRLRPELDKILYLDSDTLVTDDLSPLWNTDIGDHYAAAVQNLIEPRHMGRPQRMGIPADQTYFNSGVLLMNLAAMRQDDCVEALHAHAKEYAGVSVWPDQDSLNFVLGRRCRLLHPRWNCQNSMFYWPDVAQGLDPHARAEAIASPGILHFEGPPVMKPWHYLNRHPWRDPYLEHLAATPFRSTPLEGKTISNRIRRHIPTRFERPLTRVVARVKTTIARRK